MSTFVRVPPDSTGVRVATDRRMEIDYDNLIGTINIGDTVTGADSGATGEVTGINATGATDGEMFLKNVSGTWQDNENIEISAAPVATVAGSGFFDQDVQRVSITDPNNHHRRQLVDRFGATLNTFTEGSPTFSPFGLMMIGQPQSIKDYRFAYDEDSDYFYDQETSGATVAYESDTGAVLFTNPTTSGALASRTSHFYHPYNPGVGSTVEASIMIGDSGKANVRRRWGLFDDNNGVFWQLDGTTISVVVRSNSTGSVVDDVVNQSAFNSDKLDGTNNINLDLDVTKGNVYWVDYQWLGAGKVRFGIIEPDGSRITAHEFYHANTATTMPYMRTGTLPIRIEQENTGTAGSTSELRWVCGSVKHAGRTPVHSDRLYSYETGVSLNTVADTDGETPFFAIRPKTTLNSIENHGIIKLKSISYINNGAQPALIRYGRTDGGNMTAESFSSHASGSIVETDTSATAATISNYENAMYVAGGETREIIIDSDDTQVHANELFLEADESTQPVYCWTCETIGTGNAEVGIALQWEELLL